MLPEQALRDAPDVLCVAHWRFENLGWFIRLRKRFQITEKPYTLTGDAWRTAWAEGCEGCELNLQTGEFQKAAK